MEKYEIIKSLSDIIGFNAIINDNGTVSMFAYGKSVPDIPFYTKNIQLFDEFNEKNVAYIVKLNDNYSLVKINGEDTVIHFGFFSISNYLFHKFKVNDSIESFTKSATKISLNSLIKTITLIANLFNIININESTIFDNNFTDSDESKEMAKEADTNIIESFKEGSSHKSYDQVHRLEECVKHGNVNMTYEVCNENMNVFNDEKPIDLEMSKYLTASGLTIVTRAAIKGGVNYQLAYQLSDTYLRKIMDTTNINDLNKLYHQFVIQFTKLTRVFRSSNKENENNGSYYIVKAKKYINENVSKNIEVIDISRELGITPNYLSNIFKEETGMTISNYIREVKISIAKKMLNYSEYSLADIAYTLGYTSQSYFGKRFKEETGMTPKEYLNNLNIDDQNDFKMIKHPNESKK